MRPDQAVDQPREFAGFLEWRVDQHQPTLFLWRQVGAQRQPSVEFDDAGLEVAGEQPRQRMGIVGMLLDRRQPVLLAQEPARDQRRTRVGAQLGSRVLGADRLQVGGK